MIFGAGTFGVAVLAGLLTTLSPCVLPLLPILMGSAVTEHRLGPLALAAGVAASFTIVGVLLASAGAALGIDDEVLRKGSAVLLILFAVALLSARLQEVFASAAVGLTSSGHAALSRLTIGGLGGQFIVGLLLGVVWSPCVGPTLGAATTLASQGRNLGAISLLMLVFGIAASAPMLVIGSLSRAILLRVRGTLTTVGHRGKQILGVGILVLGALILTGTDHRLEAWLLDASPVWLTELTTRY